MHLVPALSDPQVMKGDILQWCKGLMVSIKPNYALVEQSFPSELPGDNDRMHHSLQPGFSYVGKDTPGNTL